MFPVNIFEIFDWSSESPEWRKTQSNFAVKLVWHDNFLNMVIEILLLKAIVIAFYCFIIMQYFDIDDVVPSVDVFITRFGSLLSVLILDNCISLNGY